MRRCYLYEAGVAVGTKGSSFENFPCGLRMQSSDIRGALDKFGEF